MLLSRHCAILIAEHFAATAQNVCARDMGVGRGEQGVLGPPWILKNFRKKVIFLVSSGKKNFTFGPPSRKILEKPLVTTPGKKIFPTPMAEDGAISDFFISSLLRDLRFWPVLELFRTEDNCCSYSCFQ